MTFKININNLSAAYLPNGSLVLLMDGQSICDLVNENQKLISNLVILIILLLSNARRKDR